MPLLFIFITLLLVDSILMSSTFILDFIQISNSLIHKFKRERNIPFILIVLFCGTVIMGCTTQRTVSDGMQESAAGKEQARTDSLQIPETPREFRAVWVATVANIDWPSERGLPVEEQKKELIQILNRAAAMNMNAVIFQVRPHADAMYNSQYEPWSAYLTGQMGEA